jgi:peptidase YpeB-like protein
MQKCLIVAVVAAATCAGLPALAATDAECQAMWTKADANKDGKLSDAEAQRYLAMMRVHDYKKVPPGNAVDRASFMEACKADVFAPQKAESGAPLKGANSFTEGQARDRAVAHGYANVSGLKKDDEGIWRGQATAEDGKPVEIAVDYKGNVVSTTKSR